jgi:hypothetical protein
MGYREDLSDRRAMPRKGNMKPESRMDGKKKVIWAGPAIKWEVVPRPPSIEQLG